MATSLFEKVMEFGRQRNNHADISPYLLFKQGDLSSSIFHTLAPLIISSFNRCISLAELTFRILTSFFTLRSLARFFLIDRLVVLGTVGITNKA